MKPLNPSEDLWLWASAVVFLATSAWSIRRAITDTVRLTEIDYPRGGIISDGGLDETDDVEPKIKLSTLKSLLKSPHDSIRNSAKKIIVQRCCSDPAQIRAIVDDFFSQDAGLADRASCAVDYLWWNTTTSPSHDHKIILSYEPLGIIRELVYLRTLPQHGRTSAAFWQQRCSSDQRRWAGMVDATGRSSDLQSDDPVPGLARARSIPISPAGIASRTERRRRHREVMVLHEGEGILGEDDIIRPVG